jgi:hypothetical protein
MAAVGVILQLGLLRGHILCCECCRCVAAVGVMLWSRLLHGCGGCHRTALSHGRCHCMTVVGVVSHGHGGHHVVLPQWVLLHCVLCRGRRSYMAAVGVVTLHFVSRVLLLRGHSEHRVALPQWVSL